MLHQDANKQRIKETNSNFHYFKSTNRIGSIAIANSDNEKSPCILFRIITSIMLNNDLFNQANSIETFKGKKNDSSNTANMRN